MKSLLILIFLSSMTSLFALGVKSKGGQEFGRRVTFFRTYPRIERKRSFIAHSSNAGAESDRWLNELHAWSELSLSHSYSFSFAKPIHRPSLTMPPTPLNVKKPSSFHNTPSPPPTLMRTTFPVASPTSPPIKTPTATECDSRAQPGRPASSPLPRGCLRPLVNPAELTSAPTKAALIPIGSPKTSSPTQGVSTTSPFGFKETTYPRPALKTTYPSTRPSAQESLNGTAGPTSVSSFVSGPLDVSSTDVYQCTKNGIVLVESNASTDAVGSPTTRVEISVTYLVESMNGTNFLDKLPNSLLQTAVNASLNCKVSDGSGTRQLGEENAFHRHLALSTGILGRCNAKTQHSNCYLLQTTLTYILNDSVDTAYAAYVAYLAIRDAMKQGTYTAGDPSLARVEYLSPSPTFPEPSSVSSSSTPSPSWTRQSSISAWTMGACITVSAGGLLALMVWARNRWTRHRRHILLLDEDASLASPSMIIPDEVDKGE